MRVVIATDPGDPGRVNEDWATATPDMVVVLDGATARTEIGCTHGIAWYANKLGSRIVTEAADHHVPLPEALAAAIKAVADLHPECDLSHPGTPSAAVGMMRRRHTEIEVLALADVSLVLRDMSNEIRVITDDRVKNIGVDEKTEALKYPVGDPRRNAALVAMKQVQLRARNQPGGFFVAAHDPSVAAEAVTGSLSAGTLSDIALLTDGAARLVNLFATHTWVQVMDILEAQGPDSLVRLVRSAESSDSTLERWPRSKTSDDATVAYARL